MQNVTILFPQSFGSKPRLSAYSIKSEETDNMLYYKEVKNAIKNGEFDLLYQPIFDLKERVLFGCECLMRWLIPGGGMRNPNEFLNILEQSGDIKWVGTWGLEKMIKTHDKLQEEFPTIPLKFSLNLSTKQLLDPNLANDFIDIAFLHTAYPKIRSDAIAYIKNHEFEVNMKYIGKKITIKYDF